MGLNQVIIFAYSIQALKGQCWLRDKYSKILEATGMMDEL